MTFESEIWTLELITILYIQRVTSAHPRIVARQNSLQMLANDPWPMSSNNNNSAVISPASATASSNIASQASSSVTNSLGKKKLPEEYHLDFVKDSLPELFSLLAGVSFPFLS